MKHKTITLDVDGTVRVEEYDGCPDIYRIIGRGCSTFQSLPCARLPCEALIDEEGKMDGQPVNVPATDFMRLHHVIYHADHIAGKVMLVGLPDSEGGATDIDPRMEGVIREFAAPYEPFMV